MQYWEFPVPLLEDLIPFSHVHHKAGRTRVDLNRVRPAFDPISVHMGIARFPYCVNIWFQEYGDIGRSRIVFVVASFEVQSS